MEKNTENIEFLRKTLPYWDKITITEQDTFINNMQSVKYKKGENIHNAIDNCTGMFLVKKGELRIYILSDNGKELTLFRLEKGEVCLLSCACLFKDITFDVFIDAEKDCELYLINSSILSKLHKENPIIENFSLKILIKKFSHFINKMEDMFFLSFDQRLALFLISEYKRTNNFNINLTHEDIAKYTVTAREVVSRSIKKFANKEILKLHRGKIQILKIEELYKIVDK